MDARSQRIISHIYAEKEGYTSTSPWFKRLKAQGLKPRFITMDGEKSVIRAIQEVWPKVKIQRCLYHIQREGMRWLRTYPKTQAGQDLRQLLNTLCRIRTNLGRDVFIKNFHLWLDRYQDFVLSLPRTEVAYKDLNKTMVLIYNALPDMFHYLKNRRVPKTTNTLESFYSRLKSDYQRHRGLTEKHRIIYLQWYCYYKNHAKNSNTF
jgi:transposase-like protein